MMAAYKQNIICLISLGMFVKFRESKVSSGKGGLALQACDDFLDELLSHEVGGEGRVPDIRCHCHHRCLPSKGHTCGLFLIKQLYLWPP